MAVRAADRAQDGALDRLQELVDQMHQRLNLSDNLRQIADRLPKEATEQDWLALRGNLERLADFASWFAVLHGEIDPPELGHGERLLVEEAATAAQALDWSAEPWRALTTELKQQTGTESLEAAFLALTGTSIREEAASPARRAASCSTRSASR